MHLEGHVGIVASTHAQLCSHIIWPSLGTQSSQLWPLVQSGDACTFHPIQAVTADLAPCRNGLHSGGRRNTRRQRTSRGMRRRNGASCIASRSTCVAPRLDLRSVARGRRRALRLSTSQLAAATASGTGDNSVDRQVRTGRQGQAMTGTHVDRYVDRQAHVLFAAW